MMKKFHRFIKNVLLILIGIFIFFKIDGCFHVSEKNKEVLPLKSPSFCQFSKRYPFSFMQYTNHALCRMQCRGISQNVVQKVYEEGEVNCQKSEYTNIPKGKCPRYAIEQTFLFQNYSFTQKKITPQKVGIRIVVADCADKPVLITVINLDSNWERCQCLNY